MLYNIEYLKEIDESIIETICRNLQCKAEEIRDIEPIKTGLTNITFSFRTDNGHYVYRHPGKGTSSIISRESEVFSESIAKKLGVDDSFISMDPNVGWKICRYVEDYEYIDPKNAHDRKLAMKTLHILHDSNTISHWDFDYCEQARRILDLPFFKSHVDFTEYEQIHDKMMNIGKYLQDAKYKMVLCHNDSWAYNMLKDKDDKITFIDWEYSGNSYPAADVAYFTGSYESDDLDYINLAETYEGHKLTEKETIYYFSVMAIVFWYWFIWALYKEALGKDIPDKMLWYEKAVHALERVNEVL